MYENPWFIWLNASNEWIRPMHSMEMTVLPGIKGPSLHPEDIF